jgi:hypothetical protein
MRVVVVAMVLSLAACAADRTVMPCCAGPVFLLNPGTWTPADTDLAP